MAEKMTTVNVSIAASSGPNVVSSVAASQSKTVTVGVVGQPATQPSVKPSVLLSSLPSNLQPIITAVVQSLKKNQHPPSTTQPEKPVKKYNLNVKIINPLKKSSFETYILRQVGPFNISTPLQLKQQILKQFGDKLVSSKLDFPIGYTKSVWIRSDADIEDIWSFGDTPSIWCHGVQSQMCDTSGDDDDDIEEAPTKKPRCKK